MRGTVTKFKHKFRFGFIECEKGNVYFNLSSVKDAARVKTGDVVEFDVTEEPKGLCAKNIRKVGGYEEA